MLQKTTPISKRPMWSVYVFVERGIQVGRSMVRRKRLTQISRIERRIPGELKIVIQKYLYVNVVKMYKKENILYIQVGAGKKKEIHKHDMKDVISIQIREHKRSGVQ